MDSLYWWLGFISFWSFGPVILIASIGWALDRAAMYWLRRTKALMEFAAFIEERRKK